MENFIENLIVRHGYTFVDKDKFISSKSLEQPIYSTQFYIGKNIYNTNIYCDFILYHPTKHPECLVIESKWQQIGGTVDEKYPYLVVNIKEKYQYDTILVLDGGGYKKGAEEWIRSQVGENFKHVFNMPEFQKWVNKEGI